MIEVGGGMHEAAFVDGGVSMANNPTLQLLMVATLNGFPFKWKWEQTTSCWFLWAQA